ncbi:MAG TPA: M1 family metallopeptidase, partial [Chitinophagaceae bacterium]|nr:M1 family metallopeptidase [Chitinophagaceae bacterium]
KNFEHSHDKIILTGDFKSGDTISVAVVYKGVPEDGLIISKNKFGKRTFFADNWPNRAHHWIPCVDDPADKATVEFFVFAPDHYKVIANGMLIQETPVKNNMKLTQWKEEVPLPTKVMVIGVADFAVNLSGMANGCIPVTSWVYPENIEGFRDYAIAKDILQWFINYIGPYAYPKLANVQSKTIYGGMENAGAIFYAEHTVNGQRSEERLFAHEIVHQWFGNMATEKSFAHLWLSEGFATYLTHVYLESKYGTDSLNRRMLEDREQVLDFVKYARRPVVDSTSDYMSLLNANSYQKGSWVLHMLRRQLGDSVFHKSIRDYYAQFAGKNADTRDLQRVFEKNSGKNLERFFQQWLHTAINPQLEISWKYMPGNQKVEITISQLQASAPFEFPLELSINLGKGRPKAEKLYISKKKETFVLNTGQVVTGILPDPNTSLLFEAKLIRQ